MDKDEILRAAKLSGFKVFGDRVVAADGGISGEATNSVIALGNNIELKGYAAGVREGLLTAAEICMEENCYDEHRDGTSYALFCALDGVESSIRAAAEKIGGGE